MNSELWFLLAALVYASAIIIEKFGNKDGGEN